MKIEITNLKKKNKHKKQKQKKKRKDWMWQDHVDVFNGRPDLSKFRNYTDQR